MYAFSECSDMKNISIGTSVKSISSFAFIGCTKLTSVVIPNSVTSIGFYAFFGCNLNKVIIGNIEYTSCLEIIEKKPNFNNKAFARTRLKDCEDF